MRSPLARATACPECGRPVCGVLRRTFAFLRNREKANCPYCGCPCYTPLPLYGVILAVGAACAYPVWRIGGGWGQIVEFFLLGYVLAGVPLMALVPFRARGGRSGHSAAGPDQAPLRLPGRRRLARRPERAAAVKGGLRGFVGRPPAPGALHQAKDPRRPDGLLLLAVGGAGGERGVQDGGVPCQGI